MDNVVFNVIGKADSFQRRRGPGNTNTVDSANTNRQAPSLLHRMSQAQAQGFPNDAGVPGVPTSASASSGMLSLSERISSHSGPDPPQKPTYPSLLNRLSTPATPTGPRHGGHAQGHKHPAPAALSARISPPSTSRFPPRVQQEEQVTRPKASSVSRTQILPEATHAAPSIGSAASTMTVSTKEPTTQSTGVQHSSSPVQVMETDVTSATPTPPPLTPSSVSLSPTHLSAPLSSPHASSPHPQLRGVPPAPSPCSTSSSQPLAASPHPDPSIPQSTITIPKRSPLITYPTNPVPYSNTSSPLSAAKTSSNPATLDTSQALCKTPSLTTILAFHMSPLWAESEAQAREWGEVAEQRARGRLVQEEKISESQSSQNRSLQSGRSDEKAVKEEKSANKRAREADASDATEEGLEPIHEEPPHKRAKAAIEGQAPTQVPALGQEPAPASAPTPALVAVLEPTPSPIVQPLRQSTPLKDKGDDDDDADSIISELSEIEALKALEERKREKAEQEKEVRRRNLEQELAIVRREKERDDEGERVKKAMEEEMARMERAKEERLRKEKEEKDRLLKEREQTLRDEVQKRKREKPEKPEKPVQVGVSTGAASSLGPPATAKQSAVTKHPTPALSGGVTLGPAKSTAPPAQTVFPVSVPEAQTQVIYKTVSSITAAMEPPFPGHIPHVSLPSNTANTTSLPIPAKQPSQLNVETLAPSHFTSSAMSTRNTATGQVSTAVSPMPAPIPITNKCMAPPPAPPPPCTAKTVKQEGLESGGALATSTTRSEAMQGVQGSCSSGETGAELLVDEDKPKIKPSPSISPPPPTTTSGSSLPTPVITASITPAAPAMIVRESKLEVKLEPEMPATSNPQVLATLHPSVSSAPAPAPDAGVDTSSLKPSLGHSAPTPAPGRPLKRTPSASLLTPSSKRMREASTSMSIDTEYLELTYPDGDDGMGWGGPVEGEEEERRPGRGRRARTEEEGSRSPGDEGMTPPRRMSRSVSRSPSRLPPPPSRDFRLSGSPGRVPNPRSETRSSYVPIDTRRYASGSGPHRQPRPWSPPVLRRVRSRSRSPHSTAPRSFDHWSPTPPHRMGDSNAVAKGSALPDRGYDSYVRPSDYEDRRRGVPYRPASAVSRYTTRRTPSPPSLLIWDPPQPVRPRSPIRSRAYHSKHHVPPHELSNLGYDRNNPPVRGRSPPLRPVSPVSTDEAREQHLISHPPSVRPATYDVPPSSPRRLAPHPLAQRPSFSRDRVASARLPDDVAPRSTPRFQPYPDPRSFRTFSAPIPQARVPRPAPHLRETQTINTREPAPSSQSLVDRLSPSHRSVPNFTPSGDEHVRAFESGPRRGRGVTRGRGSGPSRGQPGRAKLVARLSDAPVAGFS